MAHLGLTTGGSIGAGTALKLQDCPARVDEWAEAALSVNAEAIILVHGGPVSMPADAEYILQKYAKLPRLFMARRRWSACRPKSR